MLAGAGRQVPVVLARQRRPGFRFLPRDSMPGWTRPPTRIPPSDKAAWAMPGVSRANFAGQTASRFFGDFLYPTIFSEDPRYYRMAHGSTKARLLHAMSHAVVARRDNGKSMFNFTEWLATASSVALNNQYHPGNQPGVAARHETALLSCFRTWDSTCCASSGRRWLASSICRSAACARSEDRSKYSWHSASRPRTIRWPSSGP